MLRRKYMIILFILLLPACTKNSGNVSAADNAGSSADSGQSAAVITASDIKPVSETSGNSQPEKVEVDMQSVRIVSSNDYSYGSVPDSCVLLLKQNGFDTSLISSDSLCAYGKKLFDAGKYAEASELYRCALLLDIDNREAHYMRAGIITLMCRNGMDDSLASTLGELDSRKIVTGTNPVIDAFYFHFEKLLYLDPDNVKTYLDDDELNYILREYEDTWGHTYRYHAGASDFRLDRDFSGYKYPAIYRTKADLSGKWSPAMNTDNRIYYLHDTAGGFSLVNSAETVFSGSWKIEKDQVIMEYHIDKTDTGPAQDLSVWLDIVSSSELHYIKAEEFFDGPVKIDFDNILLKHTTLPEQAILNSRFVHLDDILKKGVDINARNYFGNTALDTGPVPGRNNEYPQLPGARSKNALCGTGG